MRCIAIRATGYDNVDLAKASQLDIRVANVPDYSPNAIAEHAVAMMLALNRKLVVADRQVHEQNFTLDNLVGFDFNSKTVGIIGLGKIGGLVAKIMHGFNCRIVAYDIVQNEDYKKAYHIDYLDLQTLCTVSDIISIHAPLNAETKYMINAGLLQQMKKGVYIINTGRGGTINTEDLLLYLQNGHIGACGLDVYEKERGIFFFDHREKNLEDRLLQQLLGFPNVLVTPHQAFAAKEALDGIATTTFENITAWVEYREAENELTEIKMVV